MNKWMLRENKIDVEALLNSGQVFRWESLDDHRFLLQYRDEAYLLRESGDELEVTGLFGGESLESIKDYLQWDRDYEAIKETLQQYPELKEPLKVGAGIRLLTQDFWETVIAFILSATNNIPRIKNSMKALSERYGVYLGTFENQRYYGFPKATDLARVDPQELRKYCGTGFRDVRIVAAAQAVMDGSLVEANLRQMNTAEAEKSLMTLPGVGEKVAACILLFGLQREDVFPVDTWMEKILLATCGLKDYNRKKMSLWGIDRYGELSGFAQQLLFYYAKDFWRKG